MEKEDIQENTFKYFVSGYHCAESIARAVIESHSETFNPEWIKAASAFQGGIGRCKQDACGALTGGIVAIGVLKGRTSPEQDNTEAAALANRFRERFINRFGSTNCAVLLNTIVNSNPEYTCKHLTRDAAGLLADVLEGDVKSNR